MPYAPAAAAEAMAECWRNSRRVTFSSSSDMERHRWNITIVGAKDGLTVRLTWFVPETHKYTQCVRRLPSISQ
jgi:hypothetical protein